MDNEEKEEHHCTVCGREMHAHPIHGILPGNGEATVNTKILDAVGCLVTKGLAMKGRFKEKDPYDVYAVVSYYKNGPLDVAKDVKRYVNEPIVKEALENIRAQFKSDKSEGPYSVARFMYPGDTDMQSRIRTDAFMRLNEFFKNL